MLVELLGARRDVHHVAQQCVGHPVGSTDRDADDHAGIDADPGRQVHLARQFGVVELALDVERGLQCRRGMVLHRQWQVEAREKPVADEAVDHAAMALDRGNDDFEVGVEDTGRLGRRQPLGETREALDIGEHDRRLGGRVDDPAGARMIVEDGHGHALAHIFAEHVADIGTFRQALDHTVELAGGPANFVVRRHRHAHREIAAADLGHRARENAKWPEQGAADEVDGNRHAEHGHGDIGEDLFLLTVAVVGEQVDHGRRQWHHGNDEQRH